MLPVLSGAEARVLGSLIEKEATTPEYYPLSVNALMNACNQKSNRDPMMCLTENDVRATLRSLTDQYLVRAASSDSRVAKYEHRINEQYNFHRNELAVMCVLLLRGPQTPGELRTRCERLYAFEDLEAVHSALNLLMKREPPLVKVLPRAAGTKESRYMHLLSGDAAPESSAQAHGVGDEAAAAGGAIGPNHAERIAQLENEVADLKRELAELRQLFENFQKQFQ